jgi:hypothetical protein
MLRSCWPLLVSVLVWDIFYEIIPPPNMCLHIYIYIYISLFDEILHYLQFILPSHLVVSSEHVLGRILHVHKISIKKCRTKHNHFSYNCPITCAWIYITEFTKQIVVAQPSDPVICLTSEFLLKYIWLPLFYEKFWYHIIFYYWKPVLAKSVYVIPL